MQVKRIANYAALDDTQPCCWKCQGGEWLLYLPGCGIGRLSLHWVTEHWGGEITVSPSISMRGHKNGKPTERHGYITYGVWKEC